MLLVLVLLVKAGLSQNTNIDYKYIIKLYNLSRYEEIVKPGFLNLTTHNYYFDKKDNLQIIHPTLAFQWRTPKNNFQEVELLDLRMEKQKSVSQVRNDSLHGIMTVSSSTLTETSVAARYEYTIVFNKKKEKKFVASLGLGGSTYYKGFKSVPQLSSSFPVAEKHIGLETFLTPRITYFMKKRIFADLNIPLCISRTEFSKEINDDPATPSAEREISTFDVSLFPKLYSVRVGIGIKL